MAGAMLSVSDSLHASLIIHHQLKQQLLESQGAGPSQRREEHVDPNQQPRHAHHGEDKKKGEDEEEEQGVGLCDQLMLVSALFGIEMSMSFDQIYEILFLQFLGVPLSLVSANGIIAGCISMIFLPVVGKWADSGNNPRARKLYSLYGGLAVFAGGLSLLAIASFLKMQQLDNTLVDLNNKLNDAPFNTSHLQPDISEMEGYRPDYTTSSRTTANITQINPVESVRTQIPKDTENPTKTVVDYTSLPGIVFLAILGFAGLDMGFDVTVSLSRALILENVPSFQHMRVLLLATVVQSSAGTSCSFIGCFDLPGTLGSTFKADGTAATLIFFCCVLLTASLVGFFLMGLASYRLGRARRGLAPHITTAHRLPSSTNSFNANATQSGESEADTVKPQLVRHRDGSRKSLLGHLEKVQEERPYIADILHTEEGDTSTRRLLLEDSLKLNYKSLNATTVSVSQEDLSPGPALENAGIDSNSGPGYPNNVSNDLDPEVITEMSLSAQARTLATQHRTFDSTGVSTVLNAIRQSYSVSMSQRAGLGDFHARKLNQLEEYQLRLNARKRKEARRKLKIKLAILCVSTFFTIGASMSFSVYASNTLNLGILHGDPTALPGTEGRENYERGLQLGAIGNLIMYTTFMTVSFGNNKIIEILGVRGQFALFHVLLITALLAIITTRLVEVYFVFMIFCGAFRTCMLTLPFVMAHNFTQEGLLDETDDPEQKVSHTGRVMTLIGFLIPTHYMILSIIMGPLMEATGDPWVPLFYCLGSSSVSLAVFSFLFFI